MFSVLLVNGCTRVLTFCTYIRVRVQLEIGVCGKRNDDLE